MLISRYMIGVDGKTAFESRRGRKCRIGTVPFGEKIWFKAIRRSKERHNKFDSEWSQGIWLGHTRNSSEVIVGTTLGVVRAWSIKRMPEKEQWDGKLLQLLAGTPQRPNPNKPGDHVPVHVSLIPPEDEEAAETAPLRDESNPRRLKLTSRVFEKYGYSEN